MGKNFIGVFPSSAAAGGGQIVLLDSHIATGTEATYTYTPATALDIDTYSEIIIVATVQVSAALALELKINGLVTNYYSDGLRSTGGAVTALSDSNLAHWIAASSTQLGAANRTAFVLVELNLLDTSLTNDGIHGFRKAYNDNLVFEESGLFHNDNNIGEISSITFETSTSTWKAGTSFFIYGVKST